MEYELVHEIKNQCPNNQMRDVFFEEVQTGDPEGYVRSMLKGELTDLSCLQRPDGVTIHAVCDGLHHVFTFTR